MRYLLLIVVVVFLAVPAVFSQQSDLFMSTGEVLVVDHQDRLDGEIERRRVELDFSSLPTELTRGDHVRISIEAYGTSKEFIIRRIQEFVPGVLSISGTPADGSRGTIAITRGHSHVLGYIDLGDSLYRIQGDEPGGTYMALMNRGEMDTIQCGWEEEITSTHSPWESNRMSTSPTGGTSVGYDAPGNEIPFTVRGMSESIWDPMTLDVLVVHTQNAYNWSLGNEGHIDNTIAQAFNLGQAALDDSVINIDLRIVMVEQVSYSESTPPPPGESGMSGWHLRRLTASPDYNPWGPGADGYMNEVHEYRDEYGADLVTLFAQVQDVGGIAWLIGNVGGTPQHGFSVNRVQQMSYTYTMIHEFGHNFGSHHGRQQNSNSAGPGGGVFPYSTGWRFNAGNQGYSTVLHYGLTGDTRIGLFSSPDLFYEGVPTGSYNQSYGPADNARSMREMKRALTFYRPTQIDPPVAGTSENAIVATTQVGGSTTHNLTITNNGTSALVWDLDFAAITPPASRHLDDETSIAILPEEAPSVGGYGNLSPTQATRDDVIYEAGFEGEEGLSPGSYLHAGGWVTHSASRPLSISTQNPSNGNQHLRIPATVPVSGTADYSSTFFGPWPAGTYEISLDFSVTQSGGNNIFVWFLDSRSGADVAGFLASPNGTVFVYNPVAQNYNSVPYTWMPGIYSSVTIRMDQDEQQLHYFFDDELIMSYELMGRKSIGQIRIQRSQGNGTNQLDLDNIRYTQIEEGLTWLSTDSYTGVTPVGGQSTVNLTFDAATSDVGERQATLVLSTNDPTSPRIEIPVTLNVTVDNEAEGDLLVSGLRGNYPNPFNDITQIEYVVAQTGSVRLDVFSVTGQFVRTLVDDVQTPGAHSVTFDSADLANGMYLYRLQTTDTVDTGRMLVVR